MKITIGPSLSTIWQHIVGGSNPCFDPFIPGEHWIGCLLGHGNGVDVEQWIGAGCQCITMNRMCRHKEHMSKITLLGIKRYTFYERLILPVIRYVDFKRYLGYLLANPCAKFAVNTLSLRGHAVAQLVKALRYKSEGRGFDFRWYH